MKKKIALFTIFFITASPQEGRSFLFPELNTLWVGPVFFGIYSSARSWWGNRKVGKSWKECILRSSVSGAISFLAQAAIFSYPSASRYIQALPFLIWSIAPKGENTIMKYVLNDIHALAFTQYFPVLSFASWCAGDSLQNLPFYAWSIKQLSSHWPEVFDAVRDDDVLVSTPVIPAPQPVVESYVKPLPPATTMPERKTSRKKIVEQQSQPVVDKSFITEQKKELFYDKKRKRSKLLEQRRKRRAAMKNDDIFSADPRDVKKKTVKRAVKRYLQDTTRPVRKTVVRNRRKKGVSRSHE